jgi:hypothetical protein
MNVKQRLATMMALALGLALSASPGAASSEDSNAEVPCPHPVTAADYVECVEHAYAESEGPESLERAARALNSERAGDASVQSSETMFFIVEDIDTGEVRDLLLDRPRGVPDAAAYLSSRLITCTLSAELRSQYRRETLSFVTDVIGTIDGRTSCDRTPSKPISATISVMVTDFGLPVLGSADSDSDSASGGLGVPLTATARVSNPVYSFPSTVRGAGSQYEWNYRATIQTSESTARKCFSANAIDPFGISSAEEPC